MQNTAMVVLGKVINEDGSLSDESNRSVKKAVDLFRDGRAPEIIMSGRWPFSMNNGAKKTEAQAMKDYAMKLGVPGEAISVEDRSMDTAGNAYFVKKMLESKPWIKTIILVTVDYHVERARFFFKRALGNIVTEVIAADSGLSGSALEVKVQSEKKTMALLRELYEKVTPENYEETVESCHPLYTKNPNAIPGVIWDEWARRGYSRERILSLGYYKSKSRD